jgi:serine/threonine protein kinase
MPLQTGTTVGVYEVTGHLGTGGMGEVYRARDTTLDWDVALKVLPDAFTDDPDRLARFEREAKVLASLNHPNIGGIHGLEDSHSTSSGQAGRALVLELVDGPTLADRIAQGPIPLDEALSIATQIAEALEAAHDQGVIHRDLKPANVKVKTDGTVKVLDFGLAKAFQPDASDPSVSMSPTMSLTVAATQMGMIVGTAAYMAPEQAAGKAVDKRCDIWAFGVVLHEMLTGQRLFSGEDVSHTLAYVLTREIDWGSLAGDTPDTLRRLLRRCLERDPRKRMRDIGEARIALNEAKAEEEPHGSSEPPQTDHVAAPEPRLWMRPVVIAAVLAALVAGAVASRLFWTPALPSPESKRFTVTLPDSDTLPQAAGELLALSPDGRTLVYRGMHEGVLQLFRRPIDIRGHADAGNGRRRRAVLLPGRSMGRVRSRSTPVESRVDRRAAPDAGGEREHAWRRLGCR